MSIFNGNVSPFTEGNSLYERNSISGLGGAKSSDEAAKSKKSTIWDTAFDSYTDDKKEDGETDYKAMLKKLLGKDDDEDDGGKKKEDKPWYETLITTGLEAFGHYNDYKANKDKEKYNREKNRILAESYSNSVRVNANDAEPYLNTGKGMNTTPPTTWSPGPGWTSPADNEAKQLAAERARNRERQEERDRRAADDANTTKTILYVAGGGVALVAVLLVAMKVTK